MPTIEVNEAKEAKTAEVAAGEMSRRQRLLPGPGSAGGYSLCPSVSSRDVPAKEVQGVIDFVRDLGPIGEVELHRAIGARRWGPGRFRAAVREAIRQGHIRRNRRRKLEVRSSDSEPDAK